MRIRNTEKNTMVGRITVPNFYGSGKIGGSEGNPVPQTCNLKLSGGRIKIPDVHS